MENFDFVYFVPAIGFLCLGTELFAAIAETKVGGGPTGGEEDSADRPATLARRKSLKRPLHVSARSQVFGRKDEGAGTSSEPVRDGKRQKTGDSAGASANVGTSSINEGECNASRFTNYDSLARSIALSLVDDRLEERDDGGNAEGRPDGSHGNKV